MISRFVFHPPVVSSQAMAYFKAMHVANIGGAQIYYLHFKYRSSPYMIEDDDEKPLTILYSHGNAEDLQTCYEKLAALSCVAGVDIVAYDYCGYGLSSSLHDKRQPSEERVYEDADVMYTELTENLKIAPHRIVLMGRSMGGGPTCYLAKKYHSSIGGVILLSTFTSCLAAVSCSWLRLFGIQDMFPNKKYLKTVCDCPVLIMHGQKDNTVSFRCAKQLLSAVKRAQKYLSEPMVSFYWFEQGKHNDIEVLYLQEMGDVVRRFLNFVLDNNAKKRSFAEL